MEATGIGRSRLSPLIVYSILVWTVLCIMGTWFIILGYGLLKGGLVATLVTFFFAAVIWVIPFAGLALLYLYAIPFNRKGDQVKKQGYGESPLLRG